MRKPQLLKEIGLTVGAVLGTLCLLGAVAAVAFGITPLVFTSGSMEPTISTGSVAMSHTIAATDVAVGDVVSLDRADGSRITHRVDSIGTVTGDSVVLNLKGDANAAVDPEQYVVVDADRVFFSVPYLGYFVAWLSTPFAWITGGVLALVLLWVAFAPDVRRLSQPSGRHAAAASVALVAVVSSVVGVGFSRSTGTEAAPLDVATAQASITAGSLATPTGVVCSGGGVLSTTLTLTIPRPVAPVTGYQMVVRNEAGTWSSAPKAFTVPASGNATVVIDLGLLGGLLGGAGFADVRSTAGNWVSVGRQSQPITALLGFFCNGAPTSQATRQARVAEAPTVAPTTTTAGPTSTTTSAPTTPTGPTTSEPVVPETVPPTTTAPLTTTPPATTTTTTTPPPPPAGAFVSAGSPKSLGEYTAGVDGGSLVITDASGTAVYTGTASSSERYGSGAIWSSDGSLYVLSDGSPVRISPADDGTFASTTISVGDLPSDIAGVL